MTLFFNKIFHRTPSNNTHQLLEAGSDEESDDHRAGEYEEISSAVIN